MSSFPNECLEYFPPVSSAFVYGSGAFQQSGHDERGMLDFIFVVDNAEAWHVQNMSLNPSHYSSLRFAGAPTVAKVNKWGPGLYFNAFVHIPNLGECKYGVVEKEDLMDDLTEWRYLFLAGRLHKPVAFSSSMDTDKPMISAVKENRLMALNMALLFLPNSFSLDRLLWEICDLSYRGDIRVRAGEDPRKVKNIVEGQGDVLSDIYQPLFPEAHISGQHTLSYDGDRQNITQRYRPLLRLGHSKHEKSDSDDIRQSLAHRVYTSSKSQALKGVLTNGPMRSLRYGLAKLGKRLK